MFLKYFYDPLLAQASYMVGCMETGEALVIDPAREISPYMQAAREQGLRIVQVAETHIHADFVSGARELAAQGAQLYLSDMGDQHWKYAYADANTKLLHDGDSWMLVNIRLEALHTPGHTPEHLIFQLTDTKLTDQPMGLFTGDCLLVGTVGRPDLLDEGADAHDSKEQGARQQFHNVQRLKTMPDYLQVWPGHGAGSACGKGLGAVPSSTLGYEKRFNPPFQFGDEEDAFADWLLKDQPEVPRYFAHMKQVNKQGAPLLSTLSAPAHLTVSPTTVVDEPSAFVIDTRAMETFAWQHIPGTIGIPATSDRFNTHVGWYVDYDAPVYLITAESDLARVLSMLRAIGVDTVAGYFTPDVVEGYDGRVSGFKPQEAARLLKDGSARLLDIRGRNEYNTSHIPGAQSLPMGHILDHLDEIPTDAPVIVNCGGGLRSQVVISLLQKRGFNNLHNLLSGIDGWKQAGLPIETG